VLPFSRKFLFLRKFYGPKGKSKEEKKSKLKEGDKSLLHMCLVFVYRGLHRK
jgi:hypothetical protein